MEHMYYKHDRLYTKRASGSGTGSKREDDLVVVEDSQKVLQEQAEVVNRYGTSRMKVRATLYLVYHHSLHNRFSLAKELL
jgi:hypothetical protein